MLKNHKNYLFLACLLVFSIVGPILLRPCLAGNQAEGESTQKSDTKLECLSIPYEKDHLSRQLWRQFLVLLVVVAAMSAAGWYLSRRLMATSTLSKSRCLRIIDTIRLSPRKSIHIVSVGKRAFLVGAGQDQIQLLADISDSIEQLEGKQ